MTGNWNDYWWSAAVLAAIFLPCASRCGATPDDGEEARSLLASVLKTRESIETIDVAFTVHQPPGLPMECRVESRGELMRGEIFSPEQDRSVVVVNGDTTWIHEVGRDLRRMKTETAKGRGVFCFDPRLIGVCQIPSLAFGPRDYINADGLKVGLADEASVDGVVCSVVKTTGYGVEGTWWIDKPSGRVHKRHVVSESQEVTIHSRFSTSSKEGVTWMPSEVLVDSDMSSRILGITVNSDPPTADRFTLQSMGVPRGTAVVDFATEQRIGYWSGEAIVEENPLNVPPERGVLALIANRWNEASWVSQGTVLLSWLIGAVMVSRFVYRWSRRGKPPTNSPIAVAE